jgi:hypothetical protein
MKISFFLPLIALLFLTFQYGNAQSPDLPLNKSKGPTLNRQAKSTKSKGSPLAKNNRAANRKLFKGKDEKVPSGYKLDNRRGAGSNSNSMQLMPKDQQKRAASMSRKNKKSNKSFNK